MARRRPASPRTIKQRWALISALRPASVPGIVRPIGKGPIVAATARCADRLAERTHHQATESRGQSKAARAFRPQDRPQRYRWTAGNRPHRQMRPGTSVDQPALRRSVCKTGILSSDSKQLHASKWARQSRATVAATSTCVLVAAAHPCARAVLQTAP